MNDQVWMPPGIICNPSPLCETSSWSQANGALVVYVNRSLVADSWFVLCDFLSVECVGHLSAPCEI